ncbi:T-cell receptor beta chain V region [Sigmodon hispidus]
MLRARENSFCTMSKQALCWVALCLLGAGITHGFLDGQVIQTPQHLFRGKGQKAKMSCRPENGHTFVYWYQQKQNKELNFLINFQRQEVREKAELVKERFLAECPLNTPCSLEIQSCEAGDSALYLCASSSYDAAVTQTPSHLIQMKGKKAKMKCSHEKEHIAVYWYQQRQSGELKFLIYLQKRQPLDQIDMVKERFSAECLSDSSCSLEIKASEIEDCTVPVCSSQSTALRCSFPSVHKRTMKPR